MKPQDIIFFIVLLIIIFSHRSSKWFVVIGISCLLISIPLFAKWVFFTAERLVWYSAVFFLCAMLKELYEYKKK